ncbi:hypothetical protein PTTG_27636 [Puccinia triticina 1-1 BBBD Race 1]|uniref:SNF2_N domain-containing protein n=1 Tax=Puccinia triticina (isolate 1-1 / race 1 (BBBD)) TaxID=630390 RepID=A0A180GIZ2_PUCT1|nr:hypothetical protein PTTG_27636 [Puccinia triticina 1-1 BBBD Race 1]
MNELAKDSNINDLWNHSVNNWIQNSCDPTNLQFLKTNEYSRRGSILADDMGLGKTLTTLELVLATKDLAKTFQTSLSNDQHIHSAATLINFPLATLSNWENKIRIHFKERAIPYMIFHGRDRGNITREDLLSSLVVLTTYEMVGTSGKRLHMNQITIESLDLFWFRIVLDEAHLITLLKISPWDEEWIWRQHLIPGMNVGVQDAIKMLNRLMETVCLRRTKDVLLNIPPKIEKVIVVSLGALWEGILRDFHQLLIQLFGRLRSTGEPWDSSEFFRQLTMIQQFCNHPVFARDNIAFWWNWCWQDLAKLVHLVENL